MHTWTAHRWARRAKLGEAVAEKLPGIVAATIEVYNTIRAELLPTPAKSHYLYNMRDLSKLFQVCEAETGCCSAHGLAACAWQHLRPAYHNSTV